MSIRLIVESALQRAYLTREQESQINHLLWQQLYSELDLDAIDQLTLALLEGQVQAEPRIVSYAA
ncbi:hypothetical protein [Thermostichus vulcanus]|uniref:Uncharacterized protein n=1 Tax=Thermostichus vulcanus str. 'Rupite' TaxID=2813851 RepID=A0ABT0CCP3_THEVL|nr:hypothetical protein [Thermostichus vulcanus]MCJ2543521.1 hypothetical protein [Thermostichus vulcanus str. 'Rupite']